MVTLLGSCFDSIIKSIRSIGKTMDHTLVAMINVLISTRPHNNANRKVIDAILAMKLYLSNGNILNSAVPLTEQESVDVNLVVSKLDMFKRYNRFITTQIEHYTLHSCSTQSPREYFTKETMTKIDNQCSKLVDRNDIIDLIKCVEIIIEDNLKKYEPLVSQIKVNDFTVDNLLMTDILEKASNIDNSLSMLRVIKVSWEGNAMKLTEVVDFVRNQINPKYLCKYQLTMLKAIVFIAYEIMKTIIQSTASSDNFFLYCYNMKEMLKAFNVISRDFVPLRIFRVYQMIVNNFKEYFQSDASINIDALIRIIEVEQYYLVSQKESSDAKVDELLHSNVDLSLGTTSESPDVEMTDSSGLWEMDVYTAEGQKYINHLLTYSVNVKEIWSNLTNVALVLDLKRMSNLQV
ncbi:uncharacterized protein LOC126839945 [Adelges cooleyi]|uniref:uncharacterized protein LOC126839945 n=1 Tax=Adelges cooleyi TaxID=133065 RepID=UPI00217F9341|nr:uncharacterized protein LOC126839945 [Adelges cooleyi]